jgi:hypothetical protein
MVLRLKKRRREEAYVGRGYLHTFDVSRYRCEVKCGETTVIGNFQRTPSFFFLILKKKHFEDIKDKATNSH